ncbi:hypothetical protein D0C36_20905 [Mucilaginibacter conchicola]|uniref:Uncharacterized protein n=2 Tax=Mucilaginibacter conchicola TaxID=2303333 RepID=A0A372NMS9_9SPHI|nr:hypothetical protein D0C36_20905 [Mucilaginibacter conchicola]
MADLPFPQNIYGTWQEAKARLRAIDSDLHCIVIADEKRQAVLATAKAMDIADLYYVPVKGFWQMSQSSLKTAEKAVVLRLFAYLNQKAGLPFFQENGSFMDYQYDTLENWLSEAETEEAGGERNWFSMQLETIYEIRRAGAHIMPLIQSPEILKYFKKVCNKNLPFVSEPLAEITDGFLKLVQDYPENSLHDHIHTELLYPNEEDAIRVEQYTGFFWSAYDTFADELDSLVTSEFQEIAVMDEPVDLKIFDELPTPETYPVLDYENRLLLLIQDLRNYLNAYEHEERHGTI